MEGGTRWFSFMLSIIDGVAGHGRARVQEALPVQKQAGHKAEQRDCISNTRRGHLKHLNSYTVEYVSCEVLPEVLCN